MSSLPFARMRADGGGGRGYKQDVEERHRQAARLRYITASAESLECEAHSCELSDS